jgi:hypothetical protein
MSARKFRIGQTVIYRAGVRGRNAPPRGTYQVVRFLPEHKDGDPGYQIRHLNEGRSTLLEKASCDRRDVTQRRVVVGHN